MSLFESKLNEDKFIDILDRFVSCLEKGNDMARQIEIDRLRDEIKALQVDANKWNY